MKSRSLNSTQCGIFGAVAAAIFSMTANASPIVLNPVDDGYVSPTFVQTSNYVISGDGSIGRGVVEFATTSFAGHVNTALLSVNPYGLPLFSPTLRVYGYKSFNGQVDLSDYSAGTVLGDWALPNLNYGQEAFFDVTSFLKTVDSPFVGFVLQGLFNPALGGVGYDVLSSLEFNYGKPSQLTVTTTVPEPATLGLLGLGLFGIVFARRRAK